MNYISELNAFNKWCETHYLTMKAQFLWYKLMAKNNALDWCEWVIVDSLELMGILRLENKQSALDVRDELLNGGLIEQIKGKKGRPSMYKMVSFDEIQKNGYKNVTEYHTEKHTEYPTENATEKHTETAKEKVTQKENIYNKTKPNETKTSNSSAERTGEAVHSTPDNAENTADSEQNSPIIVNLPLVDKTEYGVTAEKAAEYAESYPGVNIEQELRKMRQWCIDNPANRKTKRGVTRFMNSWLAKEQNRGGVWYNGGNSGNNGKNNTDVSGGKTLGNGGNAERKHYAERL